MEQVQIIGDHLIQFQFSKKSLRIILSASIFAILFSFSPIFPLFSHCVTSFSMQLFKYVTDRNYIFIFFNGILVFLIRNSGLDNDTSSSPCTVLENAKMSFDNHQLVHEVDDKRSKEVVVEVEEKKTAREEVMEVEEDRGMETENWDSEESGKENLIVEDGFEENKEEDEEEEKEQIELLSAEELNKKFDDFIRKMREGIRTEAR